MAKTGKPRKGGTVMAIKEIRDRWDLGGTVKVDISIGEQFTVHETLAGHPIVLYPVRAPARDTTSNILVQLLADESMVIS